MARKTPRAVMGDVARLGREPRDVVGLHMDVIHIRGGGPDVLGGDVAPPERLDEAAVGAEDHLAVRGAVVPDDDGLPAAEVEPRDGVLVGHPTREPERVDDRLLVGGVVPEARPTQRGAECGVVDRDDAAVAGGLVRADDELLVTELGDGVKDLHYNTLLPMTRRWISDVPS